MKKLLGLLILLLLAPTGAAQDDPRKGDDQDKKKGPERANQPTPEELLKRREAFYDLCREQELAWKGWSADLHMAITDPIADATTHRDGTLWVRKMGEDDKAKKKWAPRELAWELGQDMPDKMGKMKFTVLEASTYKMGELVRAKPWRYKSAEIWDLLAWDAFFFEMIVRDGLSKELEERFTIRMLADPRFTKTAPTADDMKHLGYNSPEEFDEAMNNKKAKFSSGKESNLSENRPFRAKEDKFDEYRRKKDGHAKEGESTTGTKLVYQIGLAPKTSSLKRAVKNIFLYVHKDKLYPVKMIIRYPGDRTVIMDLSKIKMMNPDEPYAGEKFTIDRTGLTISRPQSD